MLCCPNLIGTTGASMLLIRPLIDLNKYRRYTTHLIVFFIFLVSNIGGILTPLGDAPLFIGFLNGVDFFWPTTHLFYPLLIVGGIVLTIFWIVDHYHFYHDPSMVDPDHMQGEAKIKITGGRNLIFLCAAIAAILGESLFTAKPYINLGGLYLELAALSRDIFLFSTAYASWKLTPSKIHKSNHFTWEPLEEVGLVFLGIFITVIPVLSILKAGESGSLKSLIHFANPNGVADKALYFWLTGFLSAILDNAPTYLIFFQMAGGEAEILMNQGADILVAISAGAVFMGAMTYIGNAPNFMVRSIAIQSHIKMPGFLGYLMWSSGILLPIFIVFHWLWF
ncbi:MAG: sodium:proton antiporter [Candidatus Saccharimonadaceae bacterium]